MKKYLILAAATLAAMCACTKNEVFTPDEAITFQVANYDAATKASPKLIDNTDFGVFAYYHTGEWSSVTALPTTPYMNNVQISHRTSPTDAWAPSSPYYWPKTGKLSFAGYSPYVASTATSNKASFSLADGIVFTGWTIATAESNIDASGNKIDLMWSNEADSKDLTIENADDTHNGGTQQAYAHAGVPMLFHHALAKLNFKFVYDGTEITKDQAAMLPISVTNVDLLALKNSGTFKSKVAIDDAAWTFPETPSTVDVDLTSSEVSLTLPSADNSLGAAVNGTQNYFVIPQDPVILAINYTVNGIDPKASTETYTAQVDLGIPVTTDSGTDDTINWDVNHIYTYTISISPVTGVEILFDPAVEDWITDLNDNKVDDDDIPVVTE